MSAPVNWAKQVLALLVLANWFACIIHCQAEQARLADNPSNSSHPSFTAPSQAGGGEDCHICDWVATGGYKTSESRVAVPDLVTIPLLPIPPAPCVEPSLAQVHFAEWSTPPPDSPSTFLFVCRTALQVRAPSIAS